MNETYIYTVPDYDFRPVQFSSLLHNYAPDNGFWYSIRVWLSIRNEGW